MRDAEHQVRHPKLARFSRRKTLQRWRPPAVRRRTANPVACHCKLSFVYDELGRLKSQTSDDATIEHEFDPGGRPTISRSSLGHVRKHEYGEDGLPSALVVNGKHRFEFTRNARGEEISRLLPGGATLQQEFDSVGRIQEQKLRFTAAVRVPSASAIVGRLYKYDKQHLVGIRDQQHGTSRFSFDPAERLTRFESSNSKEQFEYDAAGNIVTKTRNDRRSTLEYREGGTLARCGTTAYEFDPQGRLIRKSEETGSESKNWYYQWDALDQLRSVRRPDGKVWTYEYDALGRRIRKTESDKSQTYIWDRNKLVHEVEGDALKATWIYSPFDGAPLAKTDGDKVFSIITDHLGTPRELVDENQSIVWSATYDAWGTASIQKNSTTECNLRFRGQWFDEETGLHYNHFRYYDPETARFLSQDPIGLLGGRNNYAYAPNPIEWIDPYGLARCPKRKRAKNRVINKGSDAPEGAGVYVFTDSRNQRYVGMTNNFRTRMGDHIDSGHLGPGTRVRFIPIDVGTRANGKPRSEQGSRRVSRFFEQQELGVDSNGNVKKNPPSVKSSRETAAVTQQKWDNHGQGTDFSDSYFD